MIDLYMFATPNSWKTSITMEETGLPYRVKWVNLRERENRTPEFLAISPLGKVPVIVDPEGSDGEPVRIYGSAPILIYLAEKAGKLLPDGGRSRAETLDWLMFSLTDLGVAMNNLNRFKVRLEGKDPFAVAQFEGDLDQMYAVADVRLAEHEFLAGEYSIADIAGFPFVGGPRRDDARLARYPNLRRWADTIGARPAVQRGLRTGP